jgi:hypothetical protein
MRAPATYVSFVDTADGTFNSLDRRLLPAADQRSVLKIVDATIETRRRSPPPPCAKRRAC